MDRWATVYVRGIFDDSVASSFTFEVDKGKHFEIEKAEKIDDEMAGVRIGYEIIFLN